MPLTILALSDCAPNFVLPLRRNDGRGKKEKAPRARPAQAEDDEEYPLEPLHQRSFRTGD